MTSVSWIILTHNRGEIVERALTHNMAKAGDSWQELIWCDNGSSDPMVKDVMSAHATVSILNSKNLGVAKGYNRAMGLATADYIVITGCDMLMPNYWLQTFRRYVEKIPHTGVACMYSSHWTSKPERIRRQFGQYMVNDLPVVDAMPIERRIFKRELLRDFGYFPETFGLYGFDDLAWAYRVEKVCEEKGLLCYVIPDMVAEHLGTEGIQHHDGKDDAGYHAFKRAETVDPQKQIELSRLRSLGWPRFSPYL